MKIDRLEAVIEKQQTSDKVQRELAARSMLKQRMDVGADGKRLTRRLAQVRHTVCSTPCVRCFTNSQSWRLNTGDELPLTTGSKDSANLRSAFQKWASFI